MSALFRSVHLSSSALRAGCLALGLAVGVALSAGPAAAGGRVVDCESGSKAPPTELIAVCGRIIDDNTTSRGDRVAALLVRAEARAEIADSTNQALADLDRAIALDHNNARAYRLRGDLTREAGGNLGRAESDLSKAITLDPQDAEAFEQRGIVYTNQHRFDRAIADYDQAIRLKPDYAQAWSDRGAAYYLSGDYKKAVSDSDEALRLDPDQPRTIRTAGPPMRSSASWTSRSPTAAKQSGEIQRIPNISTIAASPTQR